MGYFNAQLGPPPEPPEDQRQRAQAPAPEPPPQERAPEPSPKPLAPPCPLCGGAVAPDERGLWLCAGRCGRRWWRGADQRLYALEALAFGICGCCTPPMALVQSERGLCCPRSQRLHLKGPDGLVATKAFGAPCLCCAPPQELVEAPYGIVCPRAPLRPYTLVAGAWHPQPLASDPAAVISALDAALAANTAHWTINGLLCEGDTQ